MAVPRRIRILALAVAIGSGCATRAEAAGDFVSASGTHFVCRDAPFYYAGTNCYYLAYLCADVAHRGEAGQFLDICQARGLNVIRVWAFNEGGGPDAWQATPASIYNEQALQGLDYALYQARLRRLKLILTLTNNWDDYGGMNWYVGHSESADVHDDFYSDFQCRDWFKLRIQTLINRYNTWNGCLYRDDPTIFAWELANEPRAWTDPRCTRTVIRTWVSAMTAWISSLDPNHMVSIGMEGFYNWGYGSWLYYGWEGTDFVKDHQVAGVSFCTLHLYPDPGHWNLTELETKTFIDYHLADAAATIVKPLILEEFGKLDDRRDYFLEQWTTMISNSAAAGGAAAGWNIWMIEAPGSAHDDGFSLFLPGDQATVDLLTAQAVKMNTLTPPDADVNLDHAVNILDLLVIRNNLNRTPGSNAPIRTDVNRDGRINILDLLAVRNALGATWP